MTRLLFFIAPPLLADTTHFDSFSRWAFPITFAAAWYAAFWF